MDLKGWAKRLDWGYDAEVYGRGKDRVMINRNTARVIIRYKIQEGDLKPLLREGR